MNFQWYPGHMTKAKRQMQEDIKLIDLVIELVDARIPLSSRNPDIDELGKNKYRLILMNKAEAQDLQKKAKRACLSEGGLIRLVLKGYEPREKPDERFYDVMRELSAIGNNINQLAAKANTLGFVDAPQLKKEAERWHKFQADVERVFLRPNESDMKWQ